ncbi:TIGR03757 family integrating conjugative element protein [Pseudomonas sp. RL]|uniref:TIGR03757 family integrating conjugative element protein n=1 Tax=Pseudomonas sp. RL TaxID=1452718 RepID=UPI0004866003|nr:TIGR03757 family integrating conjugative element protein [Pseudomonas sp. RL]
MLRLLLARASLGLLPLALTSAGTLADASTTKSPVWVITDRWHPVRGEADRLIKLDAPARIETELSGRLSSVPREAQVRGRLWGDMHQGLRQAYQDVIEAWRLGVAKIPAVVVGGRYVVYGEPDVVRAAIRVEQWRRAQP